MKKNKKNNMRIILATVAVVLVIALYLSSESITGSFIAKSNSTIKFSREENPEWYSLLPSKPSDFDQVKYMWEMGIIRDVEDRINISYWKQPEWFPRYEEGFVKVLEGLATSNRLPIWSVGIYDAQIYRQINKEWLENPTMPTTSGYGILEIKNDSVVIKHRFWVRASVGSLRWFGVSLGTVYPSNSLLLGSAKWKLDKQQVTQDPELAKKYISIDMAESETGGKEFNLGFYWPKLMPDYQRQVDVTVEIKKDTPKGFYIVGVEVGGPSREYQIEQSWKYGLAYTDPNIGMFVNPGKFELFIEII